MRDSCKMNTAGSKIEIEPELSACYKKYLVAGGQVKFTLHLEKGNTKYEIKITQGKI